MVPQSYTSDLLGGDISDMDKRPSQKKYCPVRIELQFFRDDLVFYDVQILIQNIHYLFGLD